MGNAEGFVHFGNYGWHDTVLFFGLPQSAKHFLFPYCAMSIFTHIGSRVKVPVLLHMGKFA